jgi:DNA-binding transcriptional ArsR family regulator
VCSNGAVCAELVSGDPFEALGDGTRRQILVLLSDAEMSVGEIAAELPISRPAVSRHLRLLKNAGLVAERSEGTRRLYHLESDGIETIQSYLLGVWGEAAARFQMLADNTTTESG